MNKILKKHYIFAISLLLALSVITAVTYSFYVNKDEIINKMKLGIQVADIVEEFDGEEKEVFVENTGTTPILVRANAKMICTNESIVLNANKIATADYNLTDWMDGGDGWYYYTKILQPKETSEILVHVTTDTQDIPEDEKSLYEGAQLDVPVNMEYYKPLNDGTEYAHEVAWNLDNIAPDDTELQAVRDMLRDLIDGTTDAGEDSGEE